MGQGSTGFDFDGGGGIRTRPTPSFQQDPDSGIGPQGFGCPAGQVCVPQGTVDGQILVNISGTWTLLNPASDGAVLVMSGGLPAWFAPPGAGNFIFTSQTDVPTWVAYTPC